MILSLTQSLCSPPSFPHSLFFAPSKAPRSSQPSKAPWSGPPSKAPRATHQKPDLVKHPRSAPCSNQPSHPGSAPCSNQKHGREQPSCGQDGTVLAEFGTARPDGTRVVVRDGEGTTVCGRRLSRLRSMDLWLLRTKTRWRLGRTWWSWVREFGSGGGSWVADPKTRLDYDWIAHVPHVKLREPDVPSSFQLGFCIPALINLLGWSKYCEKGC